MALQAGPSNSSFPHRLFTWTFDPSPFLGNYKATSLLVRGAQLSSRSCIQRRSTGRHKTTAFLLTPPSTSASTQFFIFSSPSSFSIQMASHVHRFFSSLLFNQTRSATCWVAWLLSSFFASSHDATPFFLETFLLLLLTTHYTWKSKKREKKQIILKTRKKNKPHKKKKGNIQPWTQPQRNSWLQRLQ